MDWISSALGFISGLFGTHKQEQFSTEQMNWQSYQNAINRGFASAEATKAYNRGVEQWNRQNAYNTPSAQMTRMRQAGINPDLAATGGLTQGMSSFSTPPAASAPGGVSPVGSPDYNMAYRNAMEARLLEAQTKNIEADTQRTQNEASVFASDASFADALNKGKVEYLGTLISFTESGTKINEKQLPILEQSFKNLCTAGDELMERIKLIKEQTTSYNIDNIQKRIDAYYHEREVLARLENTYASTKNMLASAAFTFEQYRNYWKVITADLFSKYSAGERDSAEAALTSASTPIILRQLGQNVLNAGTEGDQMKFDLNFAKTWREKQVQADVAETNARSFFWYLSGFSSLLNGGSNALDSYGKFSAPSARPVHGFRP